MDSSTLTPATEIPVAEPSTTTTPSTTKPASSPLQNIVKTVNANRQDNIVVKLVLLFTSVCKNNSAAAFGFYLALFVVGGKGNVFSVGFLAVFILLQFAGRNFEVRSIVFVAHHFGFFKNKFRNLVFCIYRLVVFEGAGRYEDYCGYETKNPA